MSTERHEDAAVAQHHIDRAEILSCIETVPLYARHILARTMLDDTVEAVPTRVRDTWERASGTLTPFEALDAQARHEAVVCYPRRKNWRGVKCSDTPGVEAYSYRRGRAPWGGKYEHNEYYIHYAFIVPPRHGTCYSACYMGPERRARKVYVSPRYWKLEGDATWQRVPRPMVAQKLPIHVQRRLLALHTPSALRIEYDRAMCELMLVDSRGERYHLPHIGDGRTAREYVRRAVQAFRKRRDEKRREALAEQAIAQAERIWVSIDDSLRAGNCESQTRAFADRVYSDVGGRIGALRGDVLLAMRNDAYSRRALVQAAIARKYIA